MKIGVNTMKAKINNKFQDNFSDISENIYRKFTNIYRLSNRQTECLFYLSKGYSMKEIARKINVSPRTVESHMKCLKEKLNVNVRSSLVCLYYNAMLLQ